MQSTVELFGRTYSWATVITCLILTIVVGLVVLGGIKRIARVSEIIVPFMAVLYVAFALLILITNASQIPAAIATIVKSAFTGSALAGGVMGSMVVAMQKGIARGIFPMKPDLVVRRSRQQQPRQRAGTPGPRIHDRDIYRHRCYLQYDGNFHRTDRHMEYRTGRRGNHQRRISEGAAVSGRNIFLCVDALPRILCIYHDSWMGLLR